MIHFIQTHAAGGDACAPYDVKFDRPYTIGGACQRSTEYSQKRVGRI